MSKRASGGCLVALETSVSTDRLTKGQASSRAIVRLFVYVLAIALSFFSLSVVNQSNAQAEQSPRVVNGEDALKRDWASTVSLVQRFFLNEKDQIRPIRSAYWGHFCTATLLTRRLVLTAGHCVPYGVEIFPDNPEIDAVIGRTNLHDHKRGERLPVIKIALHPKFEKDTNGDGFKDYGKDIAILYLARPSKRGRPLGLSRLGGLLHSGSSARVAGWGMTATALPAKLQTAEIPLMDESYCSERMPLTKANEPFGFIKGQHICAIDPRGGPDSCRGDSGGPLMSDGNLVGIVSFGDFWCGLLEDGSPGVYLRVDSALPWIKRIVRRSKQWPGNDAKPIREKANWDMPRFVSWGLGYDSGVYESGAEFELSIFSNRRITNARISHIGPAALCPGEQFSYPYYSGQYQPTEDCSRGESLEMVTLPGGGEVAWSGWSSFAEDPCPVVRLRADVGGKPYALNFPSCEVEEILDEQISDYFESLFSSHLSRDSSRPLRASRVPITGTSRTSGIETLAPIARRNHKALSQSIPPLALRGR